MLEWKYLSELLEWTENVLVDRERNIDNLLIEMDGERKDFKEKIQ